MPPDSVGPSWCWLHGQSNSQNKQWGERWREWWTLMLESCLVSHPDCTYALANQEAIELSNSCWDAGQMPKGKHTGQKGFFWFWTTSSWSSQQVSRGGLKGDRILWRPIKCHVTWRALSRHKCPRHITQGPKAPVHIKVPNKAKHLEDRSKGHHCSVRGLCSFSLSPVAMQADIIFWPLEQDKAFPCGVDRVEPSLPRIYDIRVAQHVVAGNWT